MEGSYGAKTSVARSGFRCAAIRSLVVRRAKRNQQRSQLCWRQALRKGVEKPRQRQGLNQKSPTYEKAIHSLLRGTDGGFPSLFRSSDSLTFGQVNCPRNGDYRFGKIRLGGISRQTG